MGAKVGKTENPKINYLYVRFTSPESQSMKRISTGRTGIFCFLLAVTVLSNGCFKNITKKYLLYENDFENSELRGLEAYTLTGPVEPRPVFDFNGSKVLGPFNNNTILLNFFNLPGHNAISVEMELNIHDQWDGNYIGPTGKPDIWQMKADQGGLLITTFSNNTNVQAYPNYYLSTTPVPAKTSAMLVDVPGLCSLKGLPGGSTTYKIVKIFAHSGPNLTWSCNDALQPFNSGCLKSWSIDNLSITAIRY